MIWKKGRTLVHLKKLVWVDWKKMFVRKMRGLFTSKECLMMPREQMMLWQHLSI